jgi:hypothetical protein
MEKRVLVCGGRDFDDVRLAYSTLDSFLDGADEMTLAHGGARGADSIGGQWAVFRGVPVVVYPADWARHGRSAGPIRNALMLREFKPTIVIAFPGGKGTAHMVGIARAAGVRVEEIRRPSAQDHPEWGLGE